MSKIKKEYLEALSFAIEKIIGFTRKRRNIKVCLLNLHNKLQEGLNNIQKKDEIMNDEIEEAKSIIDEIKIKTDNLNEFLEKMKRTNEIL